MKKKVWIHSHLNSDITVFVYDDICDIDSDKNCHLGSPKRCVLP